MNLTLFDLDGTLIETDSDHAFGEFMVAIGWVDAEAFKRRNDAFYEDYQAARLDIDAYIAFAAAPLRESLAAAADPAFRAAVVRSLAALKDSQSAGLLAHLSADENLIEAFRSGQDIHTATSADMFDVPLAEVTPSMRRDAKVVNYGIIYGMGPQRLSRELGISRVKAEDYIKRYFEKFPRVQRFYNTQLEHAREKGFVATLMGRRRYLPDITSDHGGRRQLAERVATNTPIQGSAADIIKTAMVDLDAALRDCEFTARLVLQIHDELLLEAPVTEVEEVSKLVVRVMEGAAKLRVPIVVDVGSGSSWAEAH